MLASLQAFFQSVFQILISDLGSLAYHLVLSFTILALLSGALNVRGDARMARRLLWASSLLLLLRVGLFVGAGFAWQGLIPAEVLPPLDRAAALIGALAIAWMWLSLGQKRSIGVDTGAALLLLLAITGSVLALVWWGQNASGLAFNASYADQLFQVGTLVILALGMLLLLIRRPSGWSTGFAMLALLAAGHALHLAYSPAAGDFSGLIRFFELAAFPLLLALASKLDLPGHAPVSAQAAVVEASAQAPVSAPLADTAAEAMLVSLLNLAPQETCIGLAALAARWINAGWAAWIEPLPGGAGYRLLCAAGSEAEQARRSPVETRSPMPGFDALFADSQTLLLPGSAHAPEQDFLANALQIAGLAPLLAVPLNLEQGGQFALAAVRPAGGRDWAPADHERLLRLAGPLAQYYQRALLSQMAAARLSGAQKDLEEAQRQSAREQADIQRLFDELNKTQGELANERAQVQGLAAMLTVQAAASFAEPDTAAAPIPGEPAGTGGESDGQAGEDLEEVRGELRLALEEIARLRSEIPGVEAVPSGPPAHFEKLAALIQELRQPVSAAAGYSEFLLAESAGILSTMQRKFLERMRIATQRMARVVEELERLHAEGGAPPAGERQEVELGALAARIFAQVEPAMAERQIHLRKDLPEVWPRLRLAAADFERISIALLRAAGQATPPGGEVAVRLRLEHADGKQDYLLIQVADQGGGLQPGELSQVFLSGGLGQAGKPYDYSGLKHSLDRQGGRIWLDNDPGRGLRSSVLLPVDDPAGVFDAHDGGEVLP